MGHGVYLHYFFCGPHKWGNLSILQRIKGVEIQLPPITTHLLIVGGRPKLLSH